MYKGRPRGVGGNPLFYLASLVAVVLLVLSVKWLNSLGTTENVVEWGVGVEEQTGYTYLSFGAPFTISEDEWEATHVTHLNGEEASSKAHAEMATVREKHADRASIVDIKNFNLPEVDKKQAQLELVRWLDTASQFEHHAEWHWHKGHEDHFTDDTVRGLVASKDVAKGDVVNIIASEHILSTESIKLTSSAAENIPVKGTDSKDFTPLYRIMMYVLRQAVDPTSKWRTYIDALPREVDYGNFLVNWSSSELMMLDDDAVLMEASNKWKDVHRQYERLPSSLRDEWPWHAWLWSYYVVSTRAFGCKYRMCIVPLADNYNTADDSKMNTSWYFDKKTNDFYITATKAIAKGEEIFTKYGNHDNRHYLAHYGFVMPLNNDDLLTFRFQTEPGKESRLKQKLQEKNHLCQLSGGQLYCSTKRRNVEGDYQKMVNFATLATGSELTAAQKIVEQAKFYKDEHDGSMLKQFKRSGLDITNSEREDIILRFHAGYLHISTVVLKAAEATVDKNS